MASRWGVCDFFRGGGGEGGVAGGEKNVYLHVHLCASSCCAYIFCTSVVCEGVVCEGEPEKIWS